ncbi:MAG: LCP family protein [Thermaceae bacterium]|nr:LCP family protein [Thermaceae bacterium]
MRRLWLLGFLLLALGAELGYFWLEPSLRSKPQPSDAPASAEPLAPLSTALGVGASAMGLGPKLEQPLNLLVMGEDISYSGPATPVYNWKGNTDTMMLVHFDPAEKQVVVLSLPRDTYATIPGHGSLKLNAANPLGGPELAQNAVAGLLGIEVDRYVLINVFAVRDLVNTLGGVEVYVPEAMDYDDRAAKLHIHFKPGLQTMNGDQAMAYLRFRHDRIGDIGRVQRQQAFLESLLAKTKEPSAWLQAPQLFSTLSANIRTNLTEEDLARLAGFMSSKPEVVRLLLPGAFWSGGGVSYWRMDAAKTQVLVGRYLQGGSDQTGAAPGTPKTRLPSIALRGDPKQVGPVLRALRKQGYWAFAENYQVEPIQQNCVVTNGDLEGAQALANQLGLSCVQVSGTGSLYADYTLLISSQGLTLPKPAATH